jgi:hypothetical protein
MPTDGGRRRVRIDFSPFKLSRPPSPSHPSPVLVGMDAAAGEPLSSVSSIAPRKGWLTDFYLQVLNMTWTLNLFSLVLRCMPYWQLLLVKFYIHDPSRGNLHKAPGVTRSITPFALISLRFILFRLETIFQL